MKKIKLATLAIICAYCMTSCYTSSVYHGSVTPDTPVVKVNSKKNQSLLVGLIPLKSSNQIASDVIGNKEDYVTKTTWKPLDGLLHIITVGIYTPTTTEYYMKYKD